MLRGVRGATTADTNEISAIAESVQDLLKKIIETNDIHTEDIGAIIFSSTPDLNASYPAAGARALGWHDVPLFGTQEIDTPTGPPLCIRVLILWNTAKEQRLIQHIYLRGARVLRPDLAEQKM